MTSHLEVVPPAVAGERLDRFVAMVTGRSRAEAAELVDAGAVKVRGIACTVRSRRLAEGDPVEIEAPAAQGPAPVEPDPDVVFDVVYEDEHLIVVDKPADLVVHPGAGHEAATLVHGLVARFPGIGRVGQPDRPGIVHRLDRGTSGLLAVARTPEAYDALVSALSERRVGRHYTALVWGVPESRRGVVDAPIGRSPRDPTRMAVTADGRDARTHYEVTQEFAEPVPVSLLACRLETGRTHQIRVHLAAIGHPVVGDARYGGRRSAIDLDRPFLHASRLELDHPVTGEPLTFSSPLPDDLAAVLRDLR